MKNWNEFERFAFEIEQYMPATGEGETMASQATTAVNKLIYKWYNDGDVFDNNYYLEGWGNDLSSYANWLWKYLDLKMLDEIFVVRDCGEYEDLLYDIAERVLDPKNLAALSKREKAGSIYECIGPFEYTESEDEEEW